MRRSGWSARNVALTSSSFSPTLPTAWTSPTRVSSAWTLLNLWTLRVAGHESVVVTDYDAAGSIILRTSPFADRFAALSVEDQRLEENGLASSQDTVLTSGVYATTGRAIANTVNAEPYTINALDAAYALLTPTNRPSPTMDGMRDLPAGATPSLAGGFEELIEAMTVAGGNALRESFRQKYRDYMTIRPATWSRYLHLARTTSAEDRLSTLGQTFVDMHDHMFGTTESNKRNDFMQLFADWTNTQNPSERNYILPLLYPSTTHPAYVSAHAAVYGAFATVMKALVHTENVDGTPKAWPSELYVATTDSLSLISLSNATTTYVREINKMAYGYAVARMHAGQHTRSETERGLILGQEVALHYLSARACLATFDGLATSRVELFDGSYWEILCEEVRPLARPHPPPPPSSSSSSTPSPSRPPSSPPFPGDTNKTLLQTLDTADITGSPGEFGRLTPKPYLSLTFNAPVEVNEIQLVQRQMSYGDSCTKSATITLFDENDVETEYTVAYGLPSEDGVGGTLLTTFEEDTFGRHPQAEHVSVALGTASMMVSKIVYTVHAIYPYAPPAGNSDSEVAVTMRPLANHSPSSIGQTMGFTTRGPWTLGSRTCESCSMAR